MWRPIDASLTALSAQEVFMIWLKAAFISGMIVASPWIFYQIWMFVAAGLYPHEKKQVFVFLPISLLLFLAGAGLAFFFVFEPVLDFLFSFNRAMQIDPDPRISEWISFVLFLPLGFGVAFQLPLVMVFINRIGIISVSTFIEKWRIAILVIFVISMVLTPADPISMLLMAAPLSVLYFLGIGMCKWMPKGRSQFEEGYDPGE
jgi:sec-independent protein translocase protein TatC